MWEIWSKVRTALLQSFYAKTLEISSKNQTSALHCDDSSSVIISVNDRYFPVFCKTAGLLRALQTKLKIQDFDIYRLSIIFLSKTHLSSLLPVSVSHLATELLLSHLAILHPGSGASYHHWKLPGSLQRLDYSQLKRNLFSLLLWHFSFFLCCDALFNGICQIDILSYFATVYMTTTIHNCCLEGDI